MITMTIEKLTELLKQYPNETLIYIGDNNCDNYLRDITSVNIEYIGADDYQLPQIVLA